MASISHLFEDGILLFADNHAGHAFSLVAPGDHRRSDPETKYGQAQAELWGVWLSLVELAREFVRDATGRYPLRAIHGGDGIDGKGERSGGTEQIELDRNRQADLAVPVFVSTGCEEFAMVFGTGYHAGLSEDFEENIVKGLVAAGAKADIASQLHVDLGGLVLHVKHHIGGSSIPHGVHTASAREREVHLQWERDHGWPHAEISVRAHSHRHHEEGTAKAWSIVLPATLPPHTKYGGRRCFSPVDFGITALVYGGKYGFWFNTFTAVFDEYKPQIINWTGGPQNGR